MHLGDAFLTLKGIFAFVFGDLAWDLAWDFVEDLGFFAGRDLIVFITLSFSDSTIFSVVKLSKTFLFFIAEFIAASTCVESTSKA